MFKSLKIYKDQTIDLENLLSTLLELSYSRQEKIFEEGDFSKTGGIIDIWPATFEYPIRIELNLDKIERIFSFNLKDGKALWEHQIVIILPKKPAYRQAGKKASRFSVFSQDIPINNFIELNVGDYVVHVNHGVGKYLGLQKISSLEGKREHFVIEYEKKEKLYVPIEDLHLIQKYVAFEKRRPKLYRLGSKEWLHTKERTKKAIQKLALELLEVEAMRKVLPGFKYSKDSDWQRQFENTFPYKETPDQLKATQDVKKDMESGQPMDRLLCGDVGYGKTEVAMRASFKAVMDAKQVAILVPTTILAEQHYQNFLSRLKDFPINVEMLSRFKSEAQQKQIINDLKDGRVDIVIGTHRLLSDDIKFKNLGLLIIDEEQRFGVKAKEKLKTLRVSVDILTLTATPIPRTLYMSLMAAKDISVINTPPENRMPIETYVVEYDEILIKQAMERELLRKGQIYFVHNYICDIHKIKEKLEKILKPGVKLAVAHGQMDSFVLEKVMSNFLSGQIDILLSTNIIESGIDVPNANTLFVHNADNFGLSDLHQLRGRVGRFERKAYAYFLVHKKELLSNEAKKRLSSIQENWELGSGFRIAMEDLEIRGAGNLLGTEQHGYIMAVGFDLYCRLLREAINTFKKVVLSGERTKVSDTGG